MSWSIFRLIVIHRRSPAGGLESKDKKWLQLIVRRWLVRLSWESWKTALRRMETTYPTLFVDVKWFDYYLIDSRIFMYTKFQIERNGKHFRCSLKWKFQKKNWVLYIFEKSPVPGDHPNRTIRNRKCLEWTHSENWSRQVLLGSMYW